MSKVDFLDIPNEILGHIMTKIDDCKTCLEILRTCKRVHSLFDATTRTGQRVWRSIREKDGWPDPLPVGISDYGFIRAFYGRGCHKCIRHPHLRTPIWQFKGVRLCKQCWRLSTVRDYELSIPYTWYQHLPYTQDKTFSYRSYLKTDIPVSCPSRDLNDEVNQMKIITFMNAVRASQYNLGIERTRQTVTLQRAREVAIEKWLKSNVSSVHPFFYRRFDTFQNATQLATPFNKRAQALFKTKFLRELEQRKSGLIVAHVDYYMVNASEHLQYVPPALMKELPAYVTIQHQFCSLGEIPTQTQVALAVNEIEGTLHFHKSFKVLYCARCGFARSRGASMSRLTRHFTNERCKKTVLGRDGPRVAFKGT